MSPELSDHLHRAARHFLAELARRFGPPRATLCAIALQPQCDSPHPVFQVTKEEADIVLTSTDGLRAKWQLAHECVHLLDPWIPSLEGCSTNVLEEGIATWFQNTMVEGGMSDPKYRAAQKLVEPVILSLGPAIKRLRTVQGIRIGEVVGYSLREHCPSLPEQLASDLCKRFE